MKKNTIPKFNKHHIVPSASGGTNHPSNIVWVNGRLHALYHQLFVARTPEEIIEYLVDYWWGGNWAFVENALRRRNAREP